MISFFENKDITKDNEHSSYTKIAALLIHAAKIDEEYTAEEREIIENASRQREAEVVIKRLTELREEHRRNGNPDRPLTAAEFDRVGIRRNPHEMSQLHSALSDIETNTPQPQNRTPSPNPSTTRHRNLPPQPLSPDPENCRD